MKARITAAIAQARKARKPGDFEALRHLLKSIWDDTPTWAARIKGNHKPELPLSSAMFRATESAHAAWAASIDRDAERVASHMADAFAALEIALKRHADHEGMTVTVEELGYVPMTIEVVA